MSELLLGIDIGTSSCKVGLFNLNGTIVREETEAYPTYYPQEKWAEQCPNMWWEKTAVALQRLWQGNEIDKSRIKAIGIAGQSGATVMLNEAGEVLDRTPLWLDQRSEAVCHQFTQKFGEERFFEISGNPLKPMYSLPKLLWYKENKPDIFNQVKAVLQTNSFIGYKLTDALSQERSQGYGWHFFNMRTGEYDIDFCKELGLDPSLFPKIVNSDDIIGYVTEQASRETGLPVGIPVVAGGLDAACGTLGAGVIFHGQTQEQGGQAGGMSICLDEYAAEPRLILGFHVVPNKWLLQGGTVGGAGVARWMVSQFGAEENQRSEQNSSNVFYEMELEMMKVPAGSDGVLFLPYMSGERSPIWNPSAKGVYYGLDFSKTKAHFYRAGYEGVAYALNHNLKVTESVGAQIDELRAVGGAANSDLWLQIKADVTGKTMVIPRADSATTLGAAILGGIAVGLYKSYEEAVEKTQEIKKRVEPNIANETVYAMGYKNYLNLYNLLKPIMDGKTDGGD